MTTSPDELSLEELRVLFLLAFNEATGLGDGRTHAEQASLDGESLALENAYRGAYVYSLAGMTAEDLAEAIRTSREARDEAYRARPFTLDAVVILNIHLDILENQRAAHRGYR